MNENKQKAYQIVEILSRVSAKWEVSIDEILSPTRGCGSAPEARAVAMYLVQDELDIQMMKIAKVFGGRDPSIAGKAVSRIRKRMELDSEFREKVESLFEKA